MIVLIGPSASGKTEVAKELVKDQKFNKLVTYTTRKMRPLEVEGVDYHFISKEEFLDKINKNLFFEYVEYNSNFYGTLKEDITDDKVVILEPKGLKKYYEAKMPNVVSFFLSSEEEYRIKRMTFRQDDSEKIKERIASDRIVFNLSTIDGIDFVIDSDNLTITEMSKIVKDLYLNRIEVSSSNKNE